MLLMLILLLLFFVDIIFDVIANKLNKYLTKNQLQQKRKLIVANKTRQ